MTTVVWLTAKDRYVCIQFPPESLDTNANRKKAKQYDPTFPVKGSYTQAKKAT